MTAHQRGDGPLLQTLDELIEGLSEQMEKFNRGEITLAELKAVNRAAGEQIARARAALKAARVMKRERGR